MHVNTFATNPKIAMNMEVPTHKSWLDCAAVSVATGGGVGLIPWAPGTFGSLWGPVLFWGLTRSGLSLEVLLVAGVLFVIAGGPICTRAARVLGRHDPGSVVYDEIAAFWIVFLPVLVSGKPLSLIQATIGFALFRLFDISKPWPCRRLEKLPDGWGIMADDLAAGAYAAVCLLFFV